MADFGWAIQAMREGHKVSLDQTGRLDRTGRVEVLELRRIAYVQSICICTETGPTAWTPNQNDMLSEGWGIVEPNIGEPKHEVRKDRP